VTLIVDLGVNKGQRSRRPAEFIVGCFVLCWAPFFTVYLTGAFCADCTSPVVFHVFFWLGYCNSAVNPFIYGLCSRDFRYAFTSFLRCQFAPGSPACCRDRRTGSTFVRTELQHHQTGSTFGR